MVPILALLLQSWLGPATVPAANQRLDLVDEVYPVPVSDWRFIDFTLKQLPVTVRGEFEVVSGGAVRLILMRRHELKRLRERRPHGMMTVTPAGLKGSFEFPVRTSGEFVVVVENTDGDQSSDVHLKVGLEFGGRNGPAVSYLAPKRKIAVILLSFGVFFGIVTWSARRLLGAIR